MPTMTPLERSRENAGPLALRLTLEHARDLSDAEMARCFAECAAPQACRAMARVLRDAGELVRVADEWRWSLGEYPDDDAPLPSVEGR